MAAAVQQPQEQEEADGGGGGGGNDPMALFPRPPRTALDLYQDEAHMRRLSLGCPVLDATFGGGIPGHGIVEIAGMAGSGKTQLMLQLLIQQVKDAEAAWRAQGCPHPYVPSRAFFLSTEGPLPAKRLADMATAAGPEGDEGFAQRVLESVIISEAKNVEDQLFILTSQLPQLLADPQQQYGVRLCVLDSMSALFRGEFSAARADSLDRARLVFAMAKQMKRLSHDFALPFVVTNQVTADFSANSAASSSFLNSSSNNSLDVQPALGLSWSNCVHTRFLLTRRDQQGGGSSSSHFVRQMRLVLSPSLPSDLACQFKVEAGGVKGVDQAAAAAED